MRTSLFPTRFGGRPARAVVLAVALTAAGALTACGSESPLAGDDLSEADKSRIAEAWRDCLADGGVRGEIDYSSGIDIGIEVPQEMSEEQVQAIEAECEPILSDLDAAPDLSPEQEADLADAMLAVERCLADAGYVVSIEGGGISVNSADQPEDYDEAAYAEAEDRCFREAAPELFEEFGGEGG